MIRLHNGTAIAGADEETFYEHPKLKEDFGQGSV